MKTAKLNIIDVVSKVTLSLLVLTLFSMPVTGQIAIGVKGGISIPRLEGNSEQSKGYTSREAVYGGAWLNFQLTSLVSLQPEIDFSPQGGQRKGLQPVPGDAISSIPLPPGTTLYANYKTTAVLNYLEIPLLIKMTWGKKMKYFVCIGPHVAFRLEAKTKTSGSSILYLDPNGTIPITLGGTPLPAISFNGSTDIQENIKTINAGVQGGLGLQYPFGPGSILLEGRAIGGLTNIQNYPERDGKNQTGHLLFLWAI